jgi:unsaturated chondroitin disaccharide hydrolase
MGEPYLSVDPMHEGLLLHTVYHRPNGWDYVPPGSQVPHGESCMWGDYHLLELALYVKSLLSTDPSEEPYRFFVKGDTV